jgi:hypothetical protein
MIRSAMFLTALSIYYPAAAADFNGSWYDETPIGSYSILLIQRGDMVCGTWEESTRQKTWNGWIYGEVKGNKLNAQACEEPNFHPDSPGPGDCPDHGAKLYQLKNGQLLDIRLEAIGAKLHRYTYATLDYIDSGIPKNGIYDNQKDLRDYCFEHSKIILPGGMDEPQRRHKARKVEKHSN